MELYILDSSLRRAAVIDKYESLIWTERFSEYGDFELIIQSTTANRTLLSIGTKLATNVSYRVMMIETSNNSTDTEGRYLLKITGRSLEAIMLDRTGKENLSGLTADPSWIISGTPGDIAREIFQTICVDGDLDPGDIIPFITAGTIFSTDTISEPTEEIAVALELATVYDLIKQICDIYELGFRLVRNFDESELYFDIYAGSDRTSDQDDLPAVILSIDMDNLANVSELTSLENFKNVAYVFAPAGSTIVYAAGASEGTVGFDRHVLYIKADDVDETDPVDLEALLQQRGMEELTRHRSFSAMDGEIPSSSFTYGTDYQVGDLVEMRGSDGVTSRMRVTEQIFVSDSQGERSYPTLAINTFVTPGSWLAWDYNEEWVDAEGHWGDI